MSEAASTSIAVLRFCAGPLHLAIAAEDVVAVLPANDSAVHISTIFGLTPAGSDRRIIHLAPLVKGERVPIWFQADLPVEVSSCHSGDILPPPAGISYDRWRPVMGFARLDRELVLLLDIPSMIAKLIDITQGETA